MTLREFLEEFRDVADYERHVSAARLDSAIGVVAPWVDVQPLAEESLIGTANRIAAATDAELFARAFAIDPRVVFDESLSQALGSRGIIQSPADLEGFQDGALSSAEGLIGAMRDLQLALNAAVHQRVVSGRYSRSAVVSDPSADTRFGAEGKKVKGYFYAGEGWSVQCSVYESDIPGLGELKASVNAAREDWIAHVEGLIGD